MTSLYVGWSQVIMLHQFIKKSEKTPLNELKIGWKRMKEVKDEKHSEAFKARHLLARMCVANTKASRMN